MNKYEITKKQKHQFSHDGVVLLKGLFTNLIEQIAEAIDQNLANPGPYAAENLLSNESGRFFDDYCNWQRLPAIKQIVYNSEVGRFAHALIYPQSAQLFHDHVLVKN